MGDVAPAVPIVNACRQLSLVVIWPVLRGLEFEEQSHWVRNRVGALIVLQGRWWDVRGRRMYVVVVVVVADVVVLAAILYSLS
jgi:hypothetical protein